MRTPEPAGSRPVDVLVVGDCNHDLILAGDVVPRFGQEEQLLTSAETTVGGSATIVACGTARLGLATRLVAAVGDDRRGRDLVAEVAAAGVDTTSVKVRAGGPTGLSVILSALQDRSILTLPGSLPTLRAEEVEDAWLAESRHVHVASYFLLPELARGLPELLRRARAVGCTVSVDTNWDPGRRWQGVRELLPLVDVLLPNVAELLALAGEPSVDVAAAALAALGPVVAVKVGAEGALGFGPEGRVTAPGLVTDVVDTTGAGDSFDAGFIAALLDGRPFAECLRAAAAAGSLSTRAAGGTAAQPTTAELASALSP